jgi:hypothetical protein
LIRLSAAAHHGQATAWVLGLHLCEVALVGAALLYVLHEGLVLVEVERPRRTEEESHGTPSSCPYSAA